MDCIDNEIDKWWCSKFVPDPAFMNEILSQPDYNIKNTYALDVELGVDPNGEQCTKWLYELGIT